jgi:hypothetical protein
MLYGVSYGQHTCPHVNVVVQRKDDGAWKLSGDGAQLSR